MSESKKESKNISSAVSFFRQDSFTSEQIKNHVNQRFAQLMEYVKALPEDENIADYKMQLAYQLNQIELWLLYSLQHDLRYDSKKFLSEESILFYMPLALFIKTAKECLGIERPQTDFIHSAMDTIYGKLMPIMQNIDLNSSGNFAKMANGMRKRTKSFSRFFEDSSEAIGSFLKLTSHKTNVLKMFFRDGKNLYDFINYLQTTFLSAERFPLTWDSLLRSIEYRREVDVYLSIQVELAYQEEVGKLKVSCSDTLQKLKEINFDDDDEETEAKVSNEGGSVRLHMPQEFPEGMDFPEQQEEESPGVSFR